MVLVGSHDVECVTSLCPAQWRIQHYNQIKWESWRREYIYDCDIIFVLAVFLFLVITLLVIVVL